MGSKSLPSASSFVLILVLENRRENEPEAAAEITSIHPSAL
jgi:hypothetical protein